MNMKYVTMLLVLCATNVSAATIYTDESEFLAGLPGDVVNESFESNVPDYPSQFSWRGLEWSSPDTTYGVVAGPSIWAHDGVMVMSMINASNLPPLPNRWHLQASVGQITGFSGWFKGSSQARVLIAGDGLPVTEIAVHDLVFIGVVFDTPVSEVTATQTHDDVEVFTTDDVHVGLTQGPLWAITGGRLTFFGDRFSAGDSKFCRVRKIGTQPTEMRCKIGSGINAWGPWANL